ncbi:MAG: TIR domain-containing protein [Oscillospiraceae bacterium]|nr:TIR domain-containing protein [Oscillospiraceae bacterium]
MAIFKCKMCGGDLNVQEGLTVCECEYCGTKQTVPVADNEKKINAFNRANHLRSVCEFDKAAGVYESIVAEFPEEAEAYWGLCLCKFGIEYVDDPATGKKIPTCHRTAYDSIFEDGNFEQALEWADSVAHSVYRAEAKEIDRLQKEILEIAKNEQPFDVFICYKESDENGQRTVDSELAHDIYDVLTEKGYKVFYSRITLKAKLGQDYEPYIFSALNSAKVMLAIGTKYEYYNAVWVKNEWSRYLALMSKDSGKTLIPCYRDIDAYDMPKEFKHLQGQDLSSPRAFQDLVSNIEKIIPKNSNGQQNVTVKQPVIMSATSNVEPLLKRAAMCLEDEDWNKADELFEQVLNYDPENARAYMGKLCIEMHLHNLAEIADLKSPLDESNGNYKKAIRFADKQLKSELDGYNNAIKDRIENERRETVYNDGVKKFKAHEYEEAKRIFLSIQGYKDSKKLAEKCGYYINNAIYDRAYAKMNSAKTQSEYEEAKKIFASIRNFKDSIDMMEKCDEKKNLLVYNEALHQMKYAQKEADFKQIKQFFISLRGFKDSEELAKQCEDKANKARAEAMERVRQEKEEQVKQKYNSAIEDMQRDTIIMLECAIRSFKEISSYRDAMQLIEKCEKRLSELRKIEQRENERAVKAKKRRKMILGVTIPFGICAAITTIIIINIVFVPHSKYNKAMSYYQNEDYVNAADIFYELNDYKDSRELYKTSVSINTYNQALKYEQQGDYDSAIAFYAEANGYGDSHEKYSKLLRTLCFKKNTTSTIAATRNSTFGISSNGGIYWAGAQKISGLDEISRWEDVISISASGSYETTHVVGIKKDGTVVAAGNNRFGQCDVDEWRDIVAISTGTHFTVGLKSDGNVVCVGEVLGRQKKELEQLRDVIYIATTDSGTIVCVSSNGEVVKIAREYKGEERYITKVEYLTDWKDIVAVSTTWDHTVGLNADGTVVAIGDNDSGQCDVFGWTDIVAVGVGDDYTVGLKANGTVVAVGRNDNGQCDVSEWTDIVLISIGAVHTVGLKADGTVVATGGNNEGKCDVSGWKNVAMPMHIS